MGERFPAPASITAVPTFTSTGSHKSTWGRHRPGLSTEGELLCLNLCPALGETSLMLCTPRQPSPGTFLPRFCRFSCLLLPQPGTPGVVLCSRASFRQETQVFFLGGGRGGGTFCCYFGYSPASSDLWSSSGANCLSPQTWN